MLICLGPLNLFLNPRIQAVAISSTSTPSQGEATKIPRGWWLRITGSDSFENKVWGGWLLYRSASIFTMAGLVRGGLVKPLAPILLTVVCTR